MNTRVPIVTVVGHVDHGKTSLLDAIRKTSVTKREAGGITQSIGASVATTSNDSKITFIDTPGHALFANMRSRGVNMADIAILVVAADDGAQPQTKEAIKLLQESQTPFVVAVTKIDLPTANIEIALQSLEKEGVYFEKRGGDVSYIGVSSKTGEGINELLDLISLVSEVNEIKGNENDPLNGYVIETAKDKRGQLVSIVLKSGKIKIGDEIFANTLKAKVKGLFDDNQKPTKEVIAGYPAQVLGFDELPKVGSIISSEVHEEKKVENKISNNTEAKLKIFVKAKTAGSLEALLANVPAGVQVVASGVGDVIESDIFIAKAGNADIYLFESKFSNQIKKLAETESVKLERYDVIYDLLDKLSEILEKGKEEILGKAEIIASFPFNDKRVAGCKIISGKITKGTSVKLMRGEKELGRVKITSIRKQKVEALEVKQGEECGILMLPQLDFEAHDMLLSVA
ncbi:MAG TPA: translation initiation factor IF-2 [Patescibacteria group bacterium]|nr:translation initiation factor IF-2 [Patescibacteria group bacterium]